MQIVKTLRFFFSLLCTSMQASTSKRGAFLLGSFLMVVNNLFFFSLWWVFFQQFKDIRGWELADLLALTSITSGAYGLMQIAFGGVRYLSRTILNGDLDSLMTKPKNLLLHIAGSYTISMRGWGNLLTSIIATLLGKLTSFPSLSLILVGIISGCMIFTSMSIIAHSTAFWLGSIDSLAKKYCDSLFLFTLYPTNIYSGLFQWMMFTLIPAGMIGFLPVSLIKNFSWDKVLLLVGGALVFLALAFFVFYLGLKRYESGNKIGFR